MPAYTCIPSAQRRMEHEDFSKFNSGQIYIVSQLDCLVLQKNTMAKNIWGKQVYSAYTSMSRMTIKEDRIGTQAGQELGTGTGVETMVGVLLDMCMW